MDIKRPRKRPRGSGAHSQSQLPLPTATEMTPHMSKKRSPTKMIAIAICAATLATISLVTACWYNWALKAPSEVASQIRVVIDPGATSASIATTLYDHDLIRSRLAFNLYTQLTGARQQLQAGGYVFSPNQAVPAIVEHMIHGKTDQFDITILPGMTLDDLRNLFQKDGFTNDEITRAFNATYSHPLLATKPAGATLEGYIYPETYRMDPAQSLNELLNRSFDEMYKVMQDKKYLDEFTKRNLTIHEAVTLASIVQKEVSDAHDQPQVAQVFYKRLGSGTMLGSDVTFIYAAKQLGVAPSISLDSPYNTRKYTGLPPGPIANMNPSALEAVAFPAPGDFEYFVAGDDGITYFSHTEAEHEANISVHCKKLCHQ